MANQENATALRSPSEGFLIPIQQVRTSFQIFMMRFNLYSELLDQAVASDLNQAVGDL